METTRRRVKSDIYGYSQLHSGSYDLSNLTLNLRSRSVFCSWLSFWFSFCRTSSNAAQRSPQCPQERRHINQQCMWRMPGSWPLQAPLSQQLLRLLGPSSVKTRPRTRFSQTHFQVRYAAVFRTTRFRREATYLAQPEAVNRTEDLILQVLLILQWTCMQTKELWYCVPSRLIIYLLYTKTCLILHNVVNWFSYLGGGLLVFRIGFIMFTCKSLCVCDT